MRTLLSRRDLFAPQGTAVPDDERVVHIASLLLYVVPAHIEHVRAAVAALPDAEMHATAHPAKFAVVLEAADSRILADATQSLQNLTGVLTVSIVAHHSELARDLDAAMEA